MKSPCDECRKNKYCSNPCRKLKGYASSYVIENVRKRISRKDN